MANFFDAQTGQGITVVRVRQGTKFSIGLYGGGPNAERLNVTTSPDSFGLTDPDPAVKLTKDMGGWRFLYEIDTSKIKSKKIRACIASGDYSSAVAIEYVTTGGIRTSIVSLARTFVQKSHYLWGTAGNEPDQPNGNPGGGKLVAAKMRAASLDVNEKTREKVLGICMAEQPLFDGYNTCAGRSGRYSDVPDLNAYLNARQEDVKNGRTDQASWPGAGGSNLYPRKYYFKGNSAASGAVVWGESCIGVRHFDCVGLVNYCYAKHWYQSQFGMDIAAFRNPNCGTFQVTSETDLMDADILVQKDNGHIAMLYNNGAGWFVVQAESTTNGLTDTSKYNSAPWDRFRMHDAFLVGMHG